MTSRTLQITSIHITVAWLETSDYLLIRDSRSLGEALIESGQNFARSVQRQKS